MSKIDDVRKEMVVAMKAGDKARKETLSLLFLPLSKIKLSTNGRI